MTLTFTPEQLFLLFFGGITVTAVIIAYLISCVLAFSEVGRYMRGEPELGGPMMSTLGSRFMQDLVAPTLMTLLVLAGIELNAIQITMVPNFLIIAAMVGSIWLAYLSWHSTRQNFDQFWSLYSSRRRAARRQERVVAEALSSTAPSAQVEEPKPTASPDVAVQGPQPPNRLGVRPPLRARPPRPRRVAQPIH